MKGTRCDNCSEFTPAERTKDLFGSSWKTDIALCLLPNGEDIPLHFCSWACLSGYAAVKAEETAAEFEPTKGGLQ